MTLNWRKVNPGIQTSSNGQWLAKRGSEMFETNWYLTEFNRETLEFNEYWTGHFGSQASLKEYAQENAWKE